MATYYVKSGSGVAEFAQSTAYSSGDRMVPKFADAGTNFAVARKWVWECTTGGTSAAAEPTWPAAVTQDTTTVTSGGATFTARKPGFSSGTTANWTFATIYMLYALSACGSGDTVYISNNHAETQAAAYTLAAPLPLISMLCVDDATAPPTAAAATATLTTTGDSTITVGSAFGNQVLDGVILTAGSGATGTASIVLGNASIIRNCQAILASTGTSSIINLSSCRLQNVDVKFAAAAQGITASGTYWSGGSLLVGGTSPTALVKTTTGYSVLENIDLSNAAAGINIVASAQNMVAFRLRNSQTPGSWSGSINSSTVAAQAFFEASNTDNAGTNYVIQRKSYSGLVTQETTLIKSGGANDGAAGLSWKLASNTSINFPFVALETPEIVKWNATTGSAITVTVEILHDSTTALTDKEVWLEVNYLGTAGAPLGTLITDAAASVLATAADQAASTATWTTTGLTNPNTQKLSVTFTPQIAGFIHATVKLAKASKTIYVDPLLTVS